MKLILAALLLFTSQAQAATWNSLQKMVLEEGSATESPFGVIKYLEHRIGSWVIYYAVNLNSETGLIENRSAVMENWQQKTDGSYEIYQKLVWFNSEGTLSPMSHNLIHLRQDKSLESRLELAEGMAPEAFDLALWEKFLSTIDKR